MINKDCLDRVLALGGNDSVRQGMVDLFNACANEAEQKQLPTSTLVITFWDEECDLKPGDWVPELHLVVRRLEDGKDS